MADNRFVSGAKKTFIFFVFAVIALNILVDKEKPGPKECPIDSMAYSFAKMAVKDQLRSPSSASFPHPSDPKVSVVRNAEGCSFVVSGFVDGSNAFGVKIRNEYIIKMRFNRSNGMWTSSPAIFSE
jgi:hypothetical protein